MFSTRLARPGKNRTFPNVSLKENQKTYGKVKAIWFHVPVVAVLRQIFCAHGCKLQPYRDVPTRQGSFVLLVL